MTDRDDQIRQLVMDYQNVFNSEHGARVLADLSAQFHEFQQSIVFGSFDATAFNEGTHQVLRYIREKLNTKLDAPKPSETINEGTL